MSNEKQIQQTIQDFFDLIKESQLEKAYHSTTPGFQAGGAFANFQAFLEATGLINFKKAVWSDFSQDKNMTASRGVISTADNQQIPVIVYCLTDGQTWKVNDITPTEAINPASKPDLPDQSTLLSLVQNNLSLFVVAIKQEDFTDFYSQLAALWRVGTDPEKLKTAFQSLIEKKLDLTFLFSTSPVLSAKPLINDKGFLEVKGYYPSADRHLVFDLVFTYEHPIWKLLSINVSSVKL